MYNPQPIDIVTLILLTLIGSIAQLLLKRSAHGRQKGVRQLLFDPWFVGSAALLTLDTLGLIFMLRRLPLIYVTPLLSLIYFFVPLGAVVFFNERVGGRFWVGAFCLICGVIFIATA